MLDLLSNGVVNGFTDPYLYEVSLRGFYNWGKDQVKYLLFLVVLVALIAALIKRAWVWLFGVIFAAALIGIFVLNPESVLSLAEWLGKKLSI